MNKQRLIIASASAAIVTIVFVVFITVRAEFSAPLKNWLANFSGHHWTSKSIFSALVYAVATGVFYFLPQKTVDDCLKSTLRYLIVFTALGVVAVTLFFTGHHFKLF